MKTVTKRTGLCTRLGLMAACLLLGQQALAAGTTAGTVVSNQASVDYDVNGADQTDILSTAFGSAPGTGDPTTFVVDNRVDFTLVEADGALVTTGLGSTDVVTRFTLQNDGNSVQDFLLTPDNVPGAPADPFGGSQDDNTDMAAFTVFVDSNANGTYEAADDTDTWVDELAEDASVTIFVLATGPAAGLTGDVAVIDLDATVAVGGSAGATGAAIAADDRLVADVTSGAPQIVFADGVAAGSLGDGVETAQHGYIVATAELVITKDSNVLSDPFNGTTNPKAIPGAVVEYSITIENTGAQDATDIVITDLIQDPEVALATGGYAGEDIQITTTGVGGSTNTCLANADISDGCTFGTPTAFTYVIGRPGAGGLTIEAGETATILYQVSIQ